MEVNAVTKYYKYLHPKRFIEDYKNFLQMNDAVYEWILRQVTLSIKKDNTLMRLNSGLSITLSFLVADNIHRTSCEFITVGFVAKVILRNS